MFINRTDRILHNPAQLNYGIAITDVDGDGEFEAVVAGYGFSNLVLKWVNGALQNVTPPALTDPHRQAIGVAAADVDADGQEEIYILNTDTYSGPKRFADRLFDRADGEWVDLFALPIHRHILNLTSGRSVAAVDRFGRGVYGFIVANYGGPLRLYELSEDGLLCDAAGAAAVDYAADARSLLALPILTKRQDIFVGNENGPNLLFVNNGDGTFAEVAEEMSIHDPAQNARGVAALDANADGQFDIACANWEGPHRLFMQSAHGPFEDAAPAAFRAPSRARTMIAADFDNDGRVEIFINHIDEPNRLFGFRNHAWVPLEIGDALEQKALGTGAAVADFDGDGQLELLIAHGERV
ncbi:MAG TPA: VCBS repeat-containing protein, partial [Candidatus Limnocylindrales bacterium]|nr:VCBS repeat-containing protein [Candidatus Limnocylindrales bacterium]